jgi:hypothetical protein
LVREGDEVRRRVEAERPRGLQIDRQLELGWCLHRKVPRLFAPEDAVNIAAGAPK